MNFTCPHCGAIQIVTDGARGYFQAFVNIGEFAEMRKPPDGPEPENLAITGDAVRCANSECQKVSVVVELSSGYSGTYGGYPLESTEFYSVRLYPSPAGRPFPIGVPASLLRDYQEAWSIIDLSPKSSATLARRCLQGMIRDFCQIKKRTLFHEIEELERRLNADELPKGVEPETIAAMRAVKDLGNIGAHMTEVDGVILDVDPGEAEALLGLIEMLFSDWYVARHKRRERLAEIEAIALGKQGNAGKKDETSQSAPKSPSG